jgi:hypothetical protein
MTGGNDKAKPPRVKSELRPDGWERFERAVDAAVKSGPKHRTAKKQAKVSPPSNKPSKVKGR